MRFCTSSRLVLLFLVCFDLVQPSEAAFWDILLNIICLLTFGLFCAPQEPSPPAPIATPTNAPITLPPGATPKPSSGTPDDVWIPAPGTSWQWQLQGTIDTSFDVDMYDIDLEETPPETIDKLHADGRIVICYFSAGSYEAFREDKDDFAPELLGNTLDGWPDERWLDIRNVALRPILLKRLDLAVSKKCDGVEPDNVDGYQNNSGFPLTSTDQLEFNRWLAKEAHERALSIGLKNDLEQVNDLVDDFDFAVNEQCFEYQECNALSPFVAAGKAVFGVEYEGTPSVFFPQLNALQFSWLKKVYDLSALPRTDCMEI